MAESGCSEDLLRLPGPIVRDPRRRSPPRSEGSLKEVIETHLRKRLGELFELKCDLLLYDITSTYFEGDLESCPIARRGYSRDSRGQPRP